MQFPPGARFPDKLMGWSGTRDPMTTVDLLFPTKEAALRFVRKAGYDPEVRAFREHDYDVVKDYGANYEWEGAPGDKSKADKVLDGF